MVDLKKERISEIAKDIYWGDFLESREKEGVYIADEMTALMEDICPGKKFIIRKSEAFQLAMGAFLAGMIYQGGSEELEPFRGKTLQE